MLLGCLRAAVLGSAVCAASSISFLGFEVPRSDNATQSTVPDPRVLEDALEALRVMQADYFQPWLGMWPTSIDWTGAVLGSHVSGALESLSQGLEPIRLVQGDEDHKVKENLVTLYFSQLVGYYFGQDAFAIRNEAYDDMLWVVLGWLDTTQFIDLHTALHYRSATEAGSASQEVPTFLQNQTWHGNMWTPAFAHRARIFWELAAKGWDDKLCGGGMTWNPRLEPYKNAITNELFISASIAMYLYFSGDPNTSPYGGASMPGSADAGDVNSAAWRAHDPRFLAAAIEAYAWLRGSGMRNNQGLYVDGFHISGYNNRSDNNTECDLRNEMVYTYNQGVVLSGLLGLFRVTGNSSYLEDGHRLIQDVISATGYDLKHDRPVDDPTRWQPGQRLPPWRGIGRAGVIEEICDVRGDCSQDGHTFKGIFFHHLTAFCAPLDFVTAPPPAVDEQRLKQIRKEHARACEAYLGWIRHNSVAALLTRDAGGRFGMWWTAGLLNISLDALDLSQDDIGPGEVNAVDYRNDGVPDDPIWTASGTGVTPPKESLDEEHSQRPLRGHEKRGAQGSDPNTRGRGRTVETQGGGLAVLRALWEISRRSFEEI